MSATWPILERYKDIITNGLDLIAFFLATPQLLRFFAPAISRFVAIIIGMVVVGALLLPTIWLTWLSVSAMEERYWGLMENYQRQQENIDYLRPLISSLEFFLFAVVGRVVLNKLLPWVARRGQEHLLMHAFAFGVVIALLSRVLSLTIAGHEVLTSADL